MKKLMLVIAVLVLGACARKTDTTYVPVDNDGIDAVVAQENEYRALAGSLPLTPGLTCNIKSGSTLSHNFVLTSDLNMSDRPANQPVTLAPANIAGLYAGKPYTLKCTGVVIVVQADYIVATIKVDDQTSLKLGGTLVISKTTDGGMTALSGSKLLKRGAQSVEVITTQNGSGNQGFVLDLGGLNSSNFYR